MKESQRRRRCGSIRKCLKIYLQKRAPFRPCSLAVSFENGSREAVLQALQFYQNEDGGMGMVWNLIIGIPTVHRLQCGRHVEF